MAEVLPARLAAASRVVLPSAEASVAAELDGLVTQEDGSSLAVRRAITSSFVNIRGCFLDFARCALSWRATSPSGTEPVHFCACATPAPRPRAKPADNTPAVRPFMAEFSLTGEPPVLLIYPVRRTESTLGLNFLGRSIPHRN